MKTIDKIIAVSFIALSTMSFAQNGKQSLCVISIDSKGLALDPLVMGNMVRTELEKLDTFDVRDKYDVQQFMEQNKIAMTSCYGKTCLTEVGLQLKSDKMFTGAIEQQGKSIVVNYRIIDVKRSYVEKTYVHEFLNIPEEIQNMVKLSVCDMLNHPYDKNLLNKLSKRFEFDNSTNNPQIDRLKLDGPRMGFGSYSGDILKIMQDKKSNGGFDVFPAMFQFGYQFEKQYLNEGKVQALFEFIPMISGLEQSNFIPSVTLLHGLRSNVNGWEFAFGPTFNVLPMARGYYDENNNWQLQRDWDQKNKGVPVPYETKERLDSRGDYRLSSAFILAVGRTFKSGKLNIPVNAYVIPGKSGFRFGVSLGFNSRNRVL